MRLIVLVVRYREQIYALVQQLIGLFLGGITIELLIPLAFVGFPGLFSEVLTNILEVFLDLLVESTQYGLRALAHHEVVLGRYVLLLGGLHRGCHDGLFHCGAVAHGTLYHASVLLSGVFLTAGEPTLELVLTFTSQLVLDHNIIYIIHLTDKCVYYNMSTWHHSIHQDTSKVQRKRPRRAKVIGE
jgi:hypothetical protein